MNEKLKSIVGDPGSDRNMLIKFMDKPAYAIGAVAAWVFVAPIFVVAPIYALAVYKSK